MFCHVLIRLFNRLHWPRCLPDVAMAKRLNSEKTSHSLIVPSTSCWSRFVYSVNWTSSKLSSSSLSSTSADVRIDLFPIRIRFLQFVHVHSLILPGVCWDAIFRLCHCARTRYGPFISNCLCVHACVAFDLSCKRCCHVHVIHSWSANVLQNPNGQIVRITGRTNKWLNGKAILISWEEIIYSCREFNFRKNNEKKRSKRAKTMSKTNKIKQKKTRWKHNERHS